MSLLTTPNPFHHPSSIPDGNHPTQPTSNSIANLIQFARDPLGNVTGTLEDWLDDSTKKERAERQAAEDRKQLLYLKMRTVNLFQYPSSLGGRAPPPQKNQKKKKKKKTPFANTPHFPGNHSARLGNSSNGVGPSGGQ